VQLVEELNTATMTLPFNTKKDETERHDDDDVPCAAEMEHMLLSITIARAACSQGRVSRGQCDSAVAG
jgi:hypothetical protein